MPANSRSSRFVHRTLGITAALVTISSPVSAQRSINTDSVTVAPGVRARAAHTGASRAIVDSGDVKTAAALTFSELMQARGASVNVMMLGGRLVDGGNFIVRGPSTVATGGAPVLVVDGMRMAEQEDDLGSTSSRLDDIAIDDIAKVEVLRGPSAAALYGAGASAGVIVVTTKQGRAGRIRARMRAVSEGRQDAGNYSDLYRRRPVGSPGSFSCSLGSAAAHYCVPGELERWNPLAGASVFRNGLGASTSLDVAGGTNTDDVRLSATARQANGITRGDRLSQLTSRINATHRVSTWLEVTGRGAYYGNKTLGSIAGEVLEGVTNASAGATPLESFGRWADSKLSSPSIDGRLDHFTTGVDLTLRPTRWLTIRGGSSRDYVNETAERIFVNAGTLGAPYGQEAITFQRRASGWTTHRADRATGESKIPLPSFLRAEATLLAGAERERRRRYQAVEQGWFITSKSDALREFSNDAVFALGRVQFADRLAVNGGVRKEKDSGADRQWSAYPTADASLRLPLLVAGTEPRLRAAYGESAQRYAMSSFLTVEDQVPNLYSGSLPPARKLPERMKELEGGVDLDWGRNGALAFTTYRRTVTNVIFAWPGPFGAVLMKPLDLVSRGFELDARAAIVQRQSVRWELRGIVSTNANRVTSDSADVSLSNGGLVAGFPIGVAQSHPYSYTDANKDGVITRDEITTVNRVERTGGSTPTLSMALQSELRFGRTLTLTGILDRRSGAWTESGYAKTSCALAELSCKALQDPTSSLADQASAMMNTYSYGDPSFDASFTRLRELSLRWTLQPGQARFAHAQEMRLVLSGRDLATWSHWPGPDPEISGSARASITRNDRFAVPLPRRIMFGVELDY